MKSRRRNIKLLLGFDGSAYHGWQIQGHQKTIQGELQQAIGQITASRPARWGAAGPTPVPMRAAL